MTAPSVNSSPAPESPILSRLALEIVRAPEVLPVELTELRRLVYVEETKFIPESALTSSADFLGVHVFLRLDGRLVAAGHALPAVDSDFPFYSGIPPERLVGTAYSSRLIVHPDVRGAGVSRLLVYAIMREIRLMGLSSFVCFQTPGAHANKRTMGVQEIAGARRREVVGADGNPYVLIAHGQNIPYARHICFGAMTQEQRDWVADNVMVGEVMESVSRSIELFHRHEWFRRAVDGNLTREQYLQTIGCWHQFVRWTTRLLARVASITADPVLRRNFLRHLSGEVDHEKMIERDIAYLRGDVAYFRDSMAPPRHIRTFMALQESLASFHVDPELFLAVPFTIEGMSGRLGADVIDGLKACVSSWGYDEPGRAITFLASHIITDGGEDGHWNAVAAMVRRYVRTDSFLQNFLVVSGIVETAITGALTDCLEGDRWRGPAPTKPPAR